MKVRANCRINHNGKWYMAGSEFEIAEKDALALGNAVSPVMVPATSKFESSLEYSDADQPKRGRRKKETEE